MCITEHNSEFSESVFQYFQSSGDDLVIENMTWIFPFGKFFPISHSPSVQHGGLSHLCCDAGDLFMHIHQILLCTQEEITKPTWFKAVNQLYLAPENNSGTWAYRTNALSFFFLVLIFYVYTCIVDAYVIDNNLLCYNAVVLKNPQVVVEKSPKF